MPRFVAPLLRALPWIVALGAIGVVGAVQAYEGGWWRFHYPARDRYPVRGIDISHHQGEVDWDAVKRDGVAFAYIKATEGGDFVDSRFATNWREAARAGVSRGAYHFFSLCRDADAQADNFLRAVPAESQTLPPVVDLEFGGNCANRPPPAELCNALETFANRIESALQQKLIVYATHEFTAEYRPCVAGRPSWVRAIIGGPNDGSWLLWQFANRARIGGIAGPVDLDVYSGDQNSFNRLIATGKP
jgi:lysozyme